jgi:lauroyl/myristoyl acyltransferase
MNEASRTNLHDALSRERGLLLSSSHLGPFFDTSASLAEVARRRYLVHGSWFFATPSADYGGRRLAHWWQKVAHRGHHLINASNSYQTIRTLLEQGEIAVVAFDVPGSRETVFLGKRVGLASGTARLALDADALILPVRARRARGCSQVDIAPALDPRDFADAAELHDALADIHSELILELAETLEDPRRAGAWEERATAEAWTVPPRGDAMPAA